MNTPAEWHWSAEIGGTRSPDTGGVPRAFLWIPPTCARVRAVVISQHHLQEQAILEHPAFRAALAEVDFAALWIAPPLDLVFDPAAEAGRQLDAALAALSHVSGYTELAGAFLVPLGHSAASGFPWNVARWAPRRTLAVLSISGEWPYAQDERTAIVREPVLAGIPALVTLGEYESAHDRAAIGLAHRAADATLPLTMLAEAGGGHFDASDEKVAYLALYLRKAAQHRLTTDGTALRAIDPEVEGWLVDRWRFNDLPRVPAAPVAEYAEPEEAFWCFDEEHAVATEKFRADQRGKRTALLGYVQEGVVIPQIPGSHAQVTLPFPSLDDGLTFKLAGTFLDTVPLGRPERWTGLPAGTALAAPAHPGRITIERISGPVQKLAPDTFALRFTRAGLNAKHTGEIWFAAIYPGDADFRRSVQQAVLPFPLRNADGADQQITFPPLADQPRSTRELTLRATSSVAGARVRFYVREGPAVLAEDGTTLLFTAIPPRARFPLRVTVVAWQWGRSMEPKLRSAAPVERSFHLTS